MENRSEMLQAVRRDDSHAVVRYIEAQNLQIMLKY